MKNNSEKKVALWLDHSKAHFIDLSNGSPIVETVFSDRESQLRFEGETGRGTKLGGNRSTINEHHVHNREQNHLKEYYHILCDRLKNYDDLYLFGPTHAKDELYNHLKDDKTFTGKTINIRTADKMTEIQMVAEARNFFNR